MFPPIETARLRLPTLGAAFLRASLAGERGEAEALLGVALPETWPDIPEVLALRLEQLEAHPDWEPWLTRGIALREDGRLVGVTGFHGPPGGAWLAGVCPGGVEFGYTVYPAWRRRGIASEAGRALVTWASREGVTGFVLSMNAANAASVGVARRLGFVRAGSWHHAERGEEDVYRKEVAPVSAPPPPGPG